ncbi:hypothetical protein LCGC14_0264450 [marine sediment metagenome]|uniref:Uncharacterized protein n=1 Tax=marine sediment metagenome TaxID=412755 RepID=A0A0F9X5Q4_9ZZZZ
MINGAIDGAMNGAAIEIIRELGLEPIFVNLTYPQYGANNGLDVTHLIDKP